MKRLVRFLNCNKPQCNARFLHGTGVRLTPLTVLRHEARAAGWTERNSEDYCPDHEAWTGIDAWANPARAGDGEAEEPLTRRQYLHAAIAAHGRPVTTGLAEQLMADSPWPTAGRNTTRKTLRGLAKSGLLTAGRDPEGRRIYHLISTTTGEDGRA
ncbi:hypothetical protein ACFVOR_14860 [Streptomyces sp. NPDC057837]|uniref:hypothetical protein n=1 Tax=Streptomyces sp. NPDC057837 TaxID=3346260 RepID=UPI00367CB62B